MKTKITILCLLMTMVFMPVHPQKLSKEDFRDKQKSFITQQASLTPDEAAKFFPVYFELQDKKSQLNKEAWEQVRKGKDPNTTETEYNAIVENVLQARIAIDQLDLEYVKQFKTMLSAKKIYLIQKAEIKFRREILKQFKK